MPNSSTVCTTVPAVVMAVVETQQPGSFEPPPAVGVASAALPSATAPCWAAGAGAPSRRGQRKVARRASPGPNDGYASSEGGSPPVKPKGAVPAPVMRLNSLSLSPTGATAEPDAIASTADASAFFFSNEADLFKLVDSSTPAVPPLPSRASREQAPVARRGRRPPATSLPSATPAAAAAEAPPLPLPPLDTDAAMGGVEGAAEEKPSAPPSAPPVDASRRKVRHNLTERRRVDRMNQLFHQLALAICDEPAAPAITMAAMDDAERLLTAEGQELAKPKWSKADVLEGALNVVHDLRRQLAEERIARSLGVPADVELTAPDFAPSDAVLGASSADLDAISADLEAISAEEMADAADSYSSFTAASTSVSSSVHSFGYDPLGLPLSQLMDV